MKKWNKLTYDEKMASIPLYPEEALKDENWEIRIAYYREHGFTEEALKDQYSYIRLHAYRELGFKKKDLKELDRIIREEAETYFEIKGELQNEEME